ncbi:uncharacterized protein LOC117658119 [Pantherophis guttatus]|uniref:Uncharacterized protein LOC117658119 n=1 Tax=Pantherophis guttatus TaxID=94885 RepID=A0ABM3YUG9_PANGU|nr:uncharacterized protein LOC117658119 [Pantherophis guttatus]
MSQALLLFIVLICVGPSLQQLQNLKNPEFVSPGGTVTISCRYDGGNLGDGNYPWWSQQTPGNKPRSLIYHTSTRPSGVPERFSGSRSGNVMSLTITRALLEDEATYYCSVWTGSQFHILYLCPSTTSFDILGEKLLLFFSLEGPSLPKLTMGWAVVLLALLTYCTGIDGQSTGTQPPTSSVALGGTVQITCATVQSGYCIHWYQQKSRGALRYVHCDCCNRGEGIPDRFTATRSGNTGSLTITNAQGEDEADYFCGRWNSARNMFHGGTFLWGSVTKYFTLLLQPETKAKVHDLISCTTTQSSHSIFWYQQKSGKSPHYVHCDGCSSRGEGIPNRFTATRSGSTGSLAITNAQAEDEADYYCASWNTGVTQLHGGEFLWGSVTKTSEAKCNIP